MSLPVFPMFRPGGLSPRGPCCPGGLCPGGFCPGGFCPGDGLCPVGFFVKGGLCADGRPCWPSGGQLVWHRGKSEESIAQTHK